VEMEGHISGARRRQCPPRGRFILLLFDGDGGGDDDNILVSYSAIGVGLPTSICLADHACPPGKDNFVNFATTTTMRWFLAKSKTFNWLTCCNAAMPFEVDENVRGLSQERAILYNKKRSFILSL